MPSLRHTMEVVAHEAKRVAQTPRAFSNWPTLLSGLVREKLGSGPDTLTFEMRHGQRITIPNRPGARVPVYEVFAEDAYRLRWFIGDLVDRPLHVLDIGAHVGTFTSWLCNVHPTAVVDCYEPSPANVPFLRDNLAQNGLLERVTVHEAALASQEGTALLDFQGAGSGLNGLVRDGGGGSGTLTEVRTVTLDGVVAQAATPIEFVKMDCEGGEYDLVYGSSKDSWATVQRLVLEYHEVAGETWAELRDWFAAAGLRVIRDEPEHAELGTAWLSRTPA